MNKFLISYQPPKDGDYSVCNNAIRDLGEVCHPYDSLWILLYQGSKLDVLNKIWNATEQKGFLYITECSTDPICAGFKESDRAWIKRHLPRDK